MEGYPTNQRTFRTEGLAQTCRAILHCRTGHRGLKSVTGELEDSDLHKWECLTVHGRVSGSVKPSPLRSRESAQCILDVINLEPEPVNEGEVRGKWQRRHNAWCTAQGVRHGAKQEMEWENVLGTQFDLTWATRERVTSRAMCWQSVCVCTCNVRRCSVHTPRRLPGNWKLPASEKQLPDQDKKNLSESFLVVKPQVSQCWWFRP